MLDESLAELDLSEDPEDLSDFFSDVDEEEDDEDSGPLSEPLELLAELDAASRLSVR